MKVCGNSFLHQASTVTGLQRNQGSSGYKAFLSEIETQPHFVEEVPFQNEGWEKVEAK